MPYIRSYALYFLEIEINCYIEVLRKSTDLSMRLRRKMLQTEYYERIQPLYDGIFIA